MRYLTKYPFMMIVKMGESVMATLNTKSIKSINNAVSMIQWKKFKVIWKQYDTVGLYHMWSECRKRNKLNDSYELFAIANKITTPFIRDYKTAKKNFVKMVSGVY